MITIKQNVLSQTKKKYQQSLQDELTCPICLDTLENPVMCSHCHNNFCKKCIQQWEDDLNYNCPFKCVFPKYYSNLSLNKIIALISEFKIKIKTFNDNSDKEKYYEKDNSIIDNQDNVI